jgi:hypothetical protein
MKIESDALRPFDNGCPDYDRLNDPLPLKECELSILELVELVIWPHEGPEETAESARVELCVFLDDGLAGSVPVIDLLRGHCEDAFMYGGETELIALNRLRDDVDQLIKEMHEHIEMIAKRKASETDG